METKENDLAKRILTLNRTFDAPVELVWEAWTDPEHIAQWWGPKGMQVEVVEHSFKVGGKWRYIMEMPNKSQFISEGVYSEIKQFEKIISSADFKPMTEGVELRALFTRKGDKTDFTFSVVHPTEEYRRQQEEMGFYNGWGSVYDRLAQYVVTLRKK